MSTNKSILLAFTAIFLVSACVDKDTFVKHSGNMPTTERLEKLKVGQTKQQVQDLLGAPSSVISLDQDTWIYMSSDIKQFAFFKPEELDRDILRITFGKNNKVSEIERITKKDGQDVAVSGDKTETLGHKPGFFENFFGGNTQYRPM